MRTFIAIKFPAEIHQQLDKSSQALRRYLQDHNRQDHNAPDCLRWSPLSNAHLTLRFLGETSTKQIDALATKLQNIAAKQQPFALSLGGIGCFPNANRPRVLWVGVGGALTKLQALQAAAESGAQCCGFKPEKRAYSPHITLARIRRGTSRTEQKHLGQLVNYYATSQAQTSPGADSPSFSVTSISQIQSQLRPKGSVYTTLNEFALAEV